MLGLNHELRCDTEIRTLPCQVPARTQDPPGEAVGSLLLLVRSLTFVITTEFS